MRLHSIAFPENHTILECENLFLRSFCRVVSGSKTCRKRDERMIRRTIIEGGVSVSAEKVASLTCSLKTAVRCWRAVWKEVFTRYLQGIYKVWATLSSQSSHVNTILNLFVHYRRIISITHHQTFPLQAHSLTWNAAVWALATFCRESNTTCACFNLWAEGDFVPLLPLSKLLSFDFKWPSSTCISTKRISNAQFTWQRNM